MLPSICILTGIFGLKLERNTLLYEYAKGTSYIIPFFNFFWLYSFNISNFSISPSSTAFKLTKILFVTLDNTLLTIIESKSIVATLSFS